MTNLPAITPGAGRRRVLPAVEEAMTCEKCGAQMIRRDEIEARLVKIHPQPWRHETFDLGTVHCVKDADGKIVALASRVYPECMIGLDEDDAEFIAHAPDDTTWLIAELERARAEADDLAEQLRGIACRSRLT